MVASSMLSVISSQDIAAAPEPVRSMGTSLEPVHNARVSSHLGCHVRSSSLHGCHATASSHHGCHPDTQALQKSLKLVSSLAEPPLMMVWAANIHNVAASVLSRARSSP